MIPRPNSLAEVASRASAGSSFEFELADFLHEFKFRRNASMLEEKPLLLQDLERSFNVQDAYLAAVAVALSSPLGAPSPKWTREPERILREPWFASPSRHLRAVLLTESPAAFRERNLFVSANALSVA